MRGLLLMNQRILPDLKGADVALSANGHRDPVLARLGPIAPIARWIVQRIVCKAVEQNLDVWTYKALVDSPALAKGDGPIAADLSGVGPRQLIDI